MSRNEEFAQGGLFHGAMMQVDDTHIRPSSVTGAENPNTGWSYPSWHASRSWATPHAWYAGDYARRVPTDADHPINTDPDPRYRSRVYEVAGSPDMNVDDGLEVHSRTGFRIVGERDAINPGEQGTLPGINWNAFKQRLSRDPNSVSSQLVSHLDMNHYEPPEPRSDARQEDVAVHDGQLNLLSGRTAREHEEYEGTPLPLLGGVEGREDIEKDPVSVDKRNSNPKLRYVDDTYRKAMSERGVG